MYIRKLYNLLCLKDENREEQCYSLFRSQEGIGIELFSKQRGLEISLEFVAPSRCIDFRREGIPSFHAQHVRGSSLPEKETAVFPSTLEQVRKIRLYSEASALESFYGVLQNPRAHTDGKPMAYSPFVAQFSHNCVSQSLKQVQLSPFNA